MLKREYLPHMLGGLALAILFGASSVQAQNATDAAGQTKSSAATDKSAGSKMSNTDRNLMREMAYANLAEIDAGKLAQSKSQDPQVQSFGKQMVDDHTKALNDLQQLAQAKGVTLPTEPDSKHKAMMKKLEALSPTAFDRQYMAQDGVTDHRNTHKLLQRAEKRATDPDLKAAAAKMLPVVDQHLAEAEKMKGTAGAGEKATGSSGTKSKSSASGGSSSSDGSNK